MERRDKVCRECGVRVVRAGHVVLRDPIDRRSGYWSLRLGFLLVLAGLVAAWMQNVGLL